MSLPDTNTILQFHFSYLTDHQKTCDKSEKATKRPCSYCGVKFLDKYMRRHQKNVHDAHKWQYEFSRCVLPHDTKIITRYLNVSHDTAASIRYLMFCLQ